MKEISVAMRIGTHNFKVKVTQMHGRLSYEFVSCTSDCLGSKCIEVCQLSNREVGRRDEEAAAVREIDKNLKEFGVKVVEENVKSFSALLD